MDPDIQELMTELGNNLESCGRMIKSRKELTIVDIADIATALELGTNTLQSIVRTIHSRNAEIIAATAPYN